MHGWWSRETCRDGERKDVSKHSSICKPFFFFLILKSNSSFSYSVLKNTRRLQPDFHLFTWWQHASKHANQSHLFDLFNLLSTFEMRHLSYRLNSKQPLKYFSLKLVHNTDKFIKPRIQNLYKWLDVSKQWNDFAVYWYIILMYTNSNNICLKLNHNPS